MSSRHLRISGESEMVEPVAVAEKPHPWPPTIIELGVFTNVTAVKAKHKNALYDPRFFKDGTLIARFHPSRMDLAMLMVKQMGGDFLGLIKPPRSRDDS